MRPQLLFMSLVGLPVLVGCATTQTNTEHVELPGAQIRQAQQENGTIAFEVYDDHDLAKRARDLFDGEAWADCTIVLEQLLVEFPDSSHVKTARFQMAHAYIQLQDGARALVHIDAYLEGLSPTATSALRRNALFKRGAALSLLERYEEVAALFDLMLVDDDLTLRDEVEALVDSGVGHFMRGDRITSEYRFLKARRLFQRASPSDKAALRFFVAQAAFYLAELARLEFTDLKLSFPTLSDEKREDAVGLEKLLGEKLEEKCQLLLRAQFMFLRVIREEHTGWASAAGYKVGSMYEDLYAELVGLPNPDDLDDDGQQMFRRVLREKVLVLLEKAVRVWQSTADMANRTGTDNEWVAKTRDSLARVKSFVLDGSEEQAQAIAPSTAERI